VSVCVCHVIIITTIITTTLNHISPSEANSCHLVRAYFRIFHYSFLESFYFEMNEILFKI
jgi:hypothetical protein